MAGTAIAYVRVSTEEQAAMGVSLDVQTERLQAYCTLRGLDLALVVRDAGVSGSVPFSERPGGKKVVEVLASGRATHVVALKLDRLFRDAEDALHQTRVWDRGEVALHLVDMGGASVDTSTAMGRYFLTMMAGFAELERNLIAERTQLALAHKKAQRKAYAPTPYGYSRSGDELHLEPTEQAVLVLMNEWRDTGSSLRGIAERLNAEGTPTKKGRRWYASTIRYILNNSLHGEAA